ncbi:hypothetical protein B0J15DRAFT_510777 [Fusarium solani]|uniref:Uncharacterized protein n=1 Tax=Fusarium solani TaxID=169388 RepID=A0A9P9KP01_FUSSL|nr:uncharacterized protein B0J15DRAFT_510777 [Fusarium solani]KAH7265856.1 hypothetical protein B0J15DRAFT_510777 [Fusarium solani]
MNSSHSAGAEAPPKYRMLEKMPATSAYNYSNCMELSNESDLSFEQRSQNKVLRNWIRRRKSSVAAALPLWSCSELSRTSLLSRTSTSTVKAYCNAWLDRLRPGRRFRQHLDAFTVSLGPQLTMGSRPLEIEEREISVGPEHDWTTEWGWVLRLRAYTDPGHASCSHWSVDVSIFFRDLPLLLSTGGISWDRVQSSPYTHRIPSIRWRAEAVHRSRHLPLSRNSLVSLLSAETVYQAEIQQRIAVGRATRVMAYYRQVGYGNDITGQPLDVWHDGLPERFGQFIRPLMPFDPYCAEEGRNK